MSEDRNGWNSKRHDFAHNVGDSVIVSLPHETWGIFGTVIEQIVPFKYPKGDFSPKNLIYMPKSRKWGTTTRKLSYLVKMKKNDESEDDLFFWVTNDCIGVSGETRSKANMEPSQKSNMMA